MRSPIYSLRALDDKKITLKFADVARAYFLDNAQNVPPARRDSTSLFP